MIRVGNIVSFIIWFAINPLSTGAQLACERRRRKRRENPSTCQSAAGSSGGLAGPTHVCLAHAR